MTLRFGTDGVRGRADELTDELVVALGQAAAEVLGADAMVVGRDTRASGPRLEAALAEGARAAGVEPIGLGVVPTPTVAWESARSGRTGAVISASHNPWTDNGIKFFAPGGRKLSDELEERLEARLDELVAIAAPLPTGMVEPAGDPSVGTAWAEALRATVPADALRGMKVVVDCANGASSALAPGVLRDLGCDLVVLHDSPDGTNINDGCGSTHPGDLQAAVVEHGADVGLAFDGDADRVLAVDERGALVDGDHLIALFALDLQDRGRLAQDHVVVTVMTNLGFRHAMSSAGIEVVETPVGDRHVLEALQRGGWSLGGEQSGHIVFADLATTGDGLLSGLQLLDLLRRSGRPLSELAAQVMTRLPQVLVNVAVDQRRPDIADLVADAVAAEEAVLDGAGRILIRPSGTEPLVRVMVEAPSAEQAEGVAQRLAAAVGAACAT
ncbi:phosphoglucosamine mutase [Rhabdothermincola salaria]|uniref:phosphoglucosamine mutase n=1 Tax=Rhabdothermincola salaria TaxID=2903142 RepID=UPI001E3028A6|nr:phosphoglucosamine mutase [Rhabdothermincola salaria]MCD9625504.1 phosphoglucosamine mutase [Rhabdothermincola salaria]